MNLPDLDTSVCCAPLVGEALSEEDSRDLAAIFKALADPVRLRLVSIIGAGPSGEMCACDLPDLVDRSQPTVSHHLKLLTEAGIVERDQRGKWAWFRVKPERIDALSDFLKAD